MHQSITTSFKHGERGARINVKTSGGARMSVPYDHALDALDNHRAAARAMIERMKWGGKWAAGTADKSGRYVFVDTSAPGSWL